MPPLPFFFSMKEALWQSRGGKPTTPLITADGVCILPIAGVGDSRTLYNLRLGIVVLDIAGFASHNVGIFRKTLCFQIATIDAHIRAAVPVKPALLWLDKYPAINTIL